MQPDSYNKVLGKKFGLLPAPLKGVASAPKVPFFISRDSFGQGPASYWKFKDDKYYEDFGKVEVWQHLQMDLGGVAAMRRRRKPADPPSESATKDRDDNPPQVIVKLDSGKPLAVSKKVDAGEVIFIATAARLEGFDEKTLNPNWTDLQQAAAGMYFRSST